MKARLMYYTNLHPHEIPVRDVLAFSENIEDILEDEYEMQRSAVAEAVSEVLDNLKFK